MCIPGEYPCGRLGKAVTSMLSSRSIITATDRHQERSADFNMTATPESSSDNLTSEESGPEANSTTALPAVAPGVGDLSDWDFYPTLPTILEKTSSDQRIVGGNDVIPGEVPWQVGGREGGDKEMCSVFVWKRTGTKETENVTENQSKSDRNSVKSLVSLQCP